LLIRHEQYFFSQFYKGIFWLAQNVDDILLPYCTTAENIMHTYLAQSLWEKFEFHEKAIDGVAGIKMVSGFTIHLKNGVFWVVTPCGSCKNRRFGGTWRLLHQGDKNR
jgi:hypothetical protein